MLKIPLTQNKYALVDRGDYRELTKNSWCFSDTGYAKRGTKSKGKTTIHYMHRQIMKPNKGEYIDHINGNKLDNRRANLRICTQSVNGLNRKGINKNNTSGVRGVYYDKARGLYSAEIMVNRKKIYIGRYEKIDEAKRARQKAEDLYA